MSAPLWDSSTSIALSPRICLSLPNPSLTLLRRSKFKWKASHQAAFEKVKEILLQDIFLIFPNMDKPFFLHFDSSELGTGAVLQQYDKAGIFRPLKFYSKKWNPAEYNYSTPDK